MVERPNLYVKIPATNEGIPAIEESLAAGIPINITLIFSRKLYERVMEAYLRAVERRLEAGQEVREVRSVASFFVSRVDTLVDKKLQKLIDTGAADPERARSLMGRAAVANARLAYQDFKRVFLAERFRKLATKGAKVQRPLWASTSTKNPEYSDVLYVETLIGPDTVNTMPGETIEAFLDHGKVATTIGEGLDDARTVLQELESLGVSMDAVTQELLAEGIQKFSEPFEALLAAIGEKSKQLTAAS
jgi:transaldolase